MWPSVFLLIGVAVCCLGATPTFHRSQLSTVTDTHIREASGLCASRKHPGIVYTHNDSGGNDHRIYAIDAKTGHLKATLTIANTHNNDWEDIACGPCHGGHDHCIYVADTGGNAGPDQNTIYRVVEPASVHTQTLKPDSTLKFSWPEHNCETVMVDNTGEVYLVSKVRPGHGKFYHIPSSGWGHSSRVHLTGGVQLNFATPIVGGDISPDGKEVIVKSLSKIYYWYIPDRQYSAHIGHTPAKLHSYTRERQGEAVCWDKDGHGYFTLSEGHHPPLFYYQRTGQPGIVG